jgi:hypothetical protein
MGKVTKPDTVKIKHKRAGWATPEQETWLYEQIPGYLEAKALGIKALGDFWPVIVQSWFTKWPEPGVVMLPVTDGSTQNESAQDTESDLAPNVKARRDVSD